MPGTVSKIAYIHVYTSMIVMFISDSLNLKCRPRCRVRNFLSFLPASVHRKVVCTFKSTINLKPGARGGAVGRGIKQQAGRLRVRFPMVLLEFFIDIIHPVTL